MKITEMLAREDFYTINRKTLAAFFLGKSGYTKLFVYPTLNAIVTKHPSQHVRQFLYNEYDMRANPLKSLIVRTYIWMHLCTSGLLAVKKADVRAAVSDHVLIYPCNKKYRIFDFSQNFVDVITKDGFTSEPLKHEIEFRARQDLPAFVPALLQADDHRYREKIIDGRPLARIGKGFEAYRDEAFSQLRAYAKQTSVQIAGQDYANRLMEQIRSLLSAKVADEQLLLRTAEALKEIVSKIESVELCFSHGDLQAGNIWVENQTGKIFIIDWESWGERSAWYDHATLYYRLRPADIGEYLQNDAEPMQKATVVMEDIVYRLNDLSALPDNFGNEQFSAYLEKLARWMEA